MTRDKMVGWHHRLNGHEFEQAPGDGEGQGSLACYSPGGCKESDTTERLNNYRSYDEVLLLQSGLAAHPLKANIWEISVGWKRKVCFTQEASDVGRRWIHIQEPIQRFCLTVSVFKRRKGKLVSLNHLRRGSESLSSIPVGSLADSLGSRFQCCLIRGFAHRITERVVGEEVKSSINYLFFMPTSFISEKNQQVRQNSV